MISTRDRILGSKRDEASSLIASRKRKLSELYYVSRSIDPLPALNDTATYTNELREFLDLNDLEKGRLFDESTLPDQHLQHAGNSELSLQGKNGLKSTSQHDQENLRPWDKSRDDSRQTTNPKTSSKIVSPYNPATGSGKIGVYTRKAEKDDGESEISQTDEKSCSKLQNAAKASGTGRQASPPDPTCSPDSLQKGWERRRILSGVESPPGSPGVDQSQLELRPTNGLEPTSQSSDDMNESPLLQNRHNGDRTPSSINTLGLPLSKSSDGLHHATSPSSHHNLPTPISTSGTVTNHKHHDPTSPSSTVGPYSTHTPNVNTVSSDTSPDNEIQLGGLEAFDEEKERHTHKDSFDDNGLHILENSENNASSEDHVSSVDAQLRSEQKQAKGNAVSETVKITDTALHTSLTGHPVRAGHVNGQDTGVERGITSNDNSSESLANTSAEKLSTNQPIQTSTHAESTSSPSSTAVEGQQERVHGASVGHRRPKEGLEELRIPRYSSPEDLSKAEDTSNLSSLQFSNTPTKATAIPSTIRSPPERMTTRVSSGALRHKSVSEILGVTERPPSSANPDRSGDVEMADSQTLSSPAIPSDSIEPSSLARLLQEERNNRDRSKRPMIVFGSKQQDDDPKIKTKQKENDYLLTLFNSQASHAPGSISLNSLLASAPKTLTTANHYVDLHEQQDCKLLKKIYQFQYVDRWPLRQRERCAEPPRQATQWDSLLSQMKWMQTDFKEERKWKITLSKNLADACAAYVNGRQEDRTTMQVRIKKRVAPFNMDVDTEMFEKQHSTPELIASAEDGSISDAFDEEPTPNLGATAAPAAIFSLSLNEVMFGLEKTPSSERLLSELPLYEPALNLDAHIFPDTTWQLPAIPVSRFITGKIEIDDAGPPFKKCRYDFDNDMKDTRPEYLPPIEDDVALFKPESKHILDRIHAQHAFRPPSEFPMPTQSFFEARNSSQWTANEDDELRSLVKEYHYNWSLISTLLTPSTLYTSGAERRTPWECFERWIGLEGLPAEMQKTAYFRTYSSRLANAQKIVSDQQQLLAQQALQGNTPSTPIRRQRTIQPVRVERRKNTKHLAIIDAMRKLAKKRESALQKQQHAAGLQAMRKANEANQPRGPVSTPQDFSRLKHERELKIQERQEAYRQTIIASQRAVLQQRTSQQPVQTNSTPNGAPSGTNPQPRPQSTGAPNGTSPTAASAIPNNLNSSVLSSQARQNTPQTMPNGLPMSGSMPSGLNDQMPGGGFKGIPQAPMQNGGPGQRGMHSSTPERLLLENARIQYDQRRLLEQQRQLQQQGQLQGQGIPRSQIGPSSSSPNMNGMNGMGVQATMQQNNALMQALHSASNPGGIPGNDFNGFSSGTSASPRMSHSHVAGPSQPQQLSNGMIPQVNAISHQIKARYPQLSPEQVQRMAGEQLLRQHQMSQSALNAAAGAGGPTTQAAMINSNALLGNQQLYAQMLRAQQATQSRGSSSGSNGARPPSRSATPQNQRNDGTQGTGSQGQNQSPRPPQAQMAAHQ